MKLLSNKAVLMSLRYVFIVMFVLFLIFSLLELFKPQIVTNYVNLEIYLLVLILLGIFNLSFYPPEKNNVKKLNFLDYSTIGLFSVLTGILFLYLTRSIGWLSILIGLVTAIICYFFIILNYQN